jgi:putative heme-binding domain-containing protein
MRLAPLCLLLLALPLRADDLGFKVPPNFRVTLWADHTLANDIYTMCLDEKGRVVVSGPGYIRRLEDTDGDGKADKTKTGAMGLVFIPDKDPVKPFKMIVSADGKVQELGWRADARRYEPNWVRLTQFPSGEHGGHAVKLNPSGELYAICGNNTKLAPSQVGAKNDFAGGAILRLSSGSTDEVSIIAQGWRNPYDFDFTPLGDIIAFDSDTERDYGLPWYSPTRVYHVMPGAHHGWRLSGGTRSLARRDYYPDTVPILADMGRGSPTGVCCYRHYQFPEHYRGGVFLLDWTFGRVYYMPLIPEGSSYKPVKPEVFLESTGGNGFAPTAACVGPDGSLFISVGGRGTRGAVYRVEYLPDGKSPAKPRPEPEPEKDIDTVLDAPQPFEAWSVAKWQPVAKKLEWSDFAGVALEEMQPDWRRVRAFQILDKKTGNYSIPFVQAIQKSRSEVVRAQMARSLHSDDRDEAREWLWELASHPSPRVRVEALLSLSNQLAEKPQRRIRSLHVLSDNLTHEDRRVRLAACLLSARVPDSDFVVLERRTLEQKSFHGAVSLLVVHFLRSSTQSMPNLINDAAAALELTKTARDRADALRAIQLSLGDWNIHSSPIELFAAYSSPARKPEDRAYIRLVTRQIVVNVLAHYPTEDATENIEASRLLAMLSADDPPALAKTLTLLTAESHPTQDFHYLTVLARLPAPWTEDQTKQVAAALLALDKKFAENKLRPETNYPPRLRELADELIRQHPGLDKLLAAHADLTSPGNVLVAASLKGEPRKEAAKRFLVAVRDDAEFPLSAELVELLARLPAADVHPVLRARWSDRSARELLIKPLAASLQVADREKFLDVLETGQTETVSLALKALESLPRDESAKNLVPLLVRLRQALSDPKEGAIRKTIVGLVNRQAGQSVAIAEDGTTATLLAAAYRPVFAWFEKAHPAEAKQLNAASQDEAAIRQMLPTVKWEAGDVERGRKLFRDRGCQACHGGSTRLGPDLAGVGKRFSRDDLLTAIVNPSRDVAPAYRVTNIDTKDGKRLSGIVLYDSYEALLVQTATGETRRIAFADIDSRTPSPNSLMPDGLLKGIKPEELADLFAYLRQ